ncbi:hypothetical protein M426DRAFT_18535 [Hypoxylon sp. CI-4A]|nr:hypothetical protein M426DRAFT_18535 [Hypoxylon sp. CI-4A]
MMVVGCKKSFAIGAIVATAATIAAGAPVDYFPINSQLPPVARISEAFEFTFSPITFFSKSDITYKLGNAPKWLSIDSDSRRLYGTPSDEDVPPGEVVGIPIELVAEDDTGSTTTNPTLVVSRNPPPTIAVPLSEQLPKFGTYIAPSSIHLHPSKPFSFSFDEHTFRTDSGDGGLNYYAVSGDNVPLPSWMRFDAGRITFSGETPSFESLVQPPETFTFMLVASDVIGFASVSATFSIVVGNHELTAEPPLVKLNATHGKHFEYKDMKKVLKLDKKPVNPDDIATISALDLPSWLSFDNETWELSGTPEPEAESSNITIAAVDKFSDTLNLTISIRFSLFVSDIPDLDLETGKDFSFDLTKYLSSPEDVEVTVDSESGASWAGLNSSSLELSGTVPKALSARAAVSPHVVFKAISKKTHETETKVMNIHITSHTPSSHDTPPQPSNKPGNSDGDHSNKNLLWLLVIPIFFAFAGIILLLFYIRRRRQQRHRPRRPEVSGPIAGGFMATRPRSYGKGPTLTVTNMADTGHSQSSTSAQNSRASAGVSDQRSSTTGTGPSLTGNPLPHAMMAMYSRARSPEHSVILETRSSWSAGHRSRDSPPGTGNTDELSLLSDTSLGEAEAYIEEAQSYTLTRTPQIGFRSLDVPTSAEPFSIQTTPEIAYTAPNGKPIPGADEAVPPAVGYAARPKSRQQQGPGLALREVGKRISNLWKRESGLRLSPEQKRNSMHSMHSDSTGQTTATSILTSGFTGGAEEEARTSTNIVARPTIIHIPSRPGEVRHMSRRTDESSPLFGGRSLTKSPRNFGVASPSPTPVIFETPELPAAIVDFAESQDSDTSWDRLARNSLGIAYKDLVAEPVKAVPRREPLTNIVDQDNWIIHSKGRDLLSPDYWPQPTSTNMVGIARTSPANTSSELPRLPPTTTPKGENKARLTVARRPSQASTLRNMPSTSSRSEGSYTSGDDRVTITRLRSQRKPGEIRALVSQTPSPEHEWMAPNRPLPATPSHGSRTPLAIRPNGANYAPASGEGHGFGIENVPSKSWKSTRSVKSTKSVRSVWVDEDDDAWEDIRPPTTLDGWDDGGDSEGSFSVYI